MSNANPLIVTAFAPLNQVPRHREVSTYLAYGQQLLELGLPTYAFTEPSLLPVFCSHSNVLGVGTIQTQHPRVDPHLVRPPPSDRPHKDTVEYQVLMHHKFSHLLLAAQWCERVGLRPRSLAWVDFGVLHLQKASCRPLSGAHIVDWYRRILPSRQIVAAGSADYPVTPTINISQYIQWYLLGGTFTAPCQVDFLVRICARLDHYLSVHLAQYRCMPFEVNTWARDARDHAADWHIYPADHDRTLFTHYPSGV